MPWAMASSEEGTCEKGSGALEDKGRRRAPHGLVRGGLPEVLHPTSASNLSSISSIFQREIQITIRNYQIFFKKIQIDITRANKPCIAGGRVFKAKPVGKTGAKAIYIFQVSPKVGQIRDLNNRTIKKEIKAPNDDGSATHREGKPRQIAASGPLNFPRLPELDLRLKNGQIYIFPMWMSSCSLNRPCYRFLS